MDVAELGIRIDSSPAARAKQQLDAFTVSATQAEDAAQDLAATSRGRLAPGMAAGGQQSRMMAMQLSQVAQQASATGNWVQALSIQLPDMAMGFGAVGIAAGVLGSVTLPLLVSMFGQSKQASEEMTAALEKQAEISDALTAAARRLRLEREMMRSGAQFTEEQEAMNEIVSLTRERERLQVQMNALQYEDVEGTSLVAAAKRAELVAQRNVAQARIDALTAQLKELENQRRLTTASENAKAIADAYKAIQDQIASADISGPWNSVLGAIAKATEAALAYAQASQIAAGGGRGMAGPGGPLVGSPELAALQAGGGVWRNMPATSAGGGGGGGGGADPYNDRLTALVETLRSEREIEDEWYAENLALLTDRRAQELLGKQQHDAALVSLHEEYQRRIADIDANSMQSRLSDASNLFSGLAGIAEAGGRKQLKTAATLSAAATTIAGYEAAMTAAAKAPTLAGKIAAYAGWLGTAAKAVGAIRSAGGIGGGGSLGGAQIAAQGVTTQPQMQPVEFRIYGLDKKRRYTGEELQEIFDGMLEEGKRRGAPTPSITIV